MHVYNMYTAVVTCILDGMWHFIEGLKRGKITVMVSYIRPKWKYRVM